MDRVLGPMLDFIVSQWAVNNMHGLSAGHSWALRDDLAVNNGSQGARDKLCKTREVYIQLKITLYGKEVKEERIIQGLVSARSFFKSFQYSFTFSDVVCALCFYTFI